MNGRRALLVLAAVLLTGCGHASREELRRQLTEQVRSVDAEVHDLVGVTPELTMAKITRAQREYDGCGDSPAACLRVRALMTLRGGGEHRLNDVSRYLRRHGWRIADDSTTAGYRRVSLDRDGLTVILDEQVPNQWTGVAQRWSVTIEGKRIDTHDDAFSNRYLGPPREYDLRSDDSGAQPRT